MKPPSPVKPPPLPPAQPPAPPGEPPGVPPWLITARGELGVRERTASGTANPRIAEYFQATGYKGGTALDAWCSAFANWAMLQCGLQGSGKASARSWCDWGVELAEPRVGCIAVYSRGSANGGQGHVGFWTASDQLYDHVLGGNEGNAVAIKPYARARLLGYRWVG